MSKDNGGPAFPIPLNQGTSYQGHGGEVDGMTLRDYFAAKAMQGILANVHERAMTMHFLVSESYMIADAMLAERAK